MRPETRTTKHIEPTVETVEIEEIKCPVCQQWYADEDELTVVGVGLDYDASGEVVGPKRLTQVCTSCTESLFDVEVPASAGRLSDIKTALSRPLVDLGDVSVPTHVIKPLLSAAIGLAVTGIVASVGLNVANDVAAQVEPSNVEQVGAPLGFLDLAPILLLVAVAWVVLQAPRIGRFR